jgi:virginiamycin B lyase
MRYRTALLVFLGIALLLGGCGQSPTSPFREFSLPTTCGQAVHGLLSGCTPAGITRGPDGNLWFTESAGNKIGRLTPAGRLSEFALPTTCGDSLGCGPDGITSGPDGALWFTEATGNRIGRITSAGRISEFPLPTTCPQDVTGLSLARVRKAKDAAIAGSQEGGGTGMAAGSRGVWQRPLDNEGSGCHPVGITSGPDGNLWFTEAAADRIGRLTPAGGVSEFALPSTCHTRLGCGPAGITSGPDGNLWFAEAAGNQIGRMTPAGRISEYALPTTCSDSPGCGPAGITSGPDGALWFAESAGNQIGQLLPPK